MRARFTLAASALCLAAACAGAPPSPAPDSPDAKVLSISDAVVADAFDESPGSAALRRIPGTHYDRLPDDSITGVAARAAQRSDWAKQLKTIPKEKLKSESARLALSLTRERLDALVALRICRFELWNVSQMNGWLVKLTDLAQAQPIETEALRAETLTRWTAIDATIDVQTANLREGIRLGYVAPRPVVERVLAQLDAVIATPLDSSPLASPAQRSSDAAFQQRIYEIVKKRILPAATRHRDFLRDEYLIYAREEIGVSANPDGAACYRAATRYASTLDVTPDEIHAQGKKQLDTLTKEMQALSKKSFGNTPIPDLLKQFRTDPKYLYKNAADLMAQAQQSMARASSALPKAFGLRPDASVRLEPIPKFQEKSAAPHYLAAAVDGSRPATYRVRTFEAEKQSRVIGESTAFHEVVPGHHLQIAIASERDELPAIARFLGTSGFSEGWALYAERLADEMGLYTSDADRMGMLSNAQWRAVRLIVDSGIHARGWTRDQAIELLLANTALSKEQAAAEIDRYIAWPGQATSYMLGYLEIAQLRRQAQLALEDDFELREFHDRVLENGNVTLPVLRERVETWTLREGKARK